MEITIKKSLGIMPVLVDEAKRLSEVIEVNRIILSHFRIDTIVKHARFTLVLGGIDSRGKFHLDLSRGAAEIIIGPDKCTNFDEIFCDRHGACTTLLNEDMFVQILMDYGLPGAYKWAEWGRLYPDLAVEINGQPVDLKKFQ
jgi:hypothetical protein